MTAPPASFLATRRGRLTLLLLSAVQFLDVADSSIMNVALPSIRRDLGFSVQNLQWVLSGYLVTYGGLRLLSGRAGDLLGRRRLLVAGTIVFAACSLAGGLAASAGMLIAARLGQGAGAAMMAPAGLSILTTTFSQGTDRSRALGAWGAVSGLAAAAGVFLGGVLSQGPGWRWVLFVNLPVCALILAGAARLLPAERHRARQAKFDVVGAVLGTAGMVLLVYALVRAPQQGWGSAHMIGELAIAGAVLAAFTLTELRRRDPLFPFSIFRTRGLAAADLTQMIAFAGFVSVFFFLTLYMQNVLDYTPIRGGAAYLPVTASIAIAAGISSKLSARTGTRPVIVAGSLIAAAGIYYLSRIPVHGSYPASLLPGLVIMAIGLGAVLVSVTTAANADVAPDQAGLAAGLLATSQQLGTALGLAIFSAIATARTSALRRPHPASGGAHRRIPARPADLRDLPARRRHHRAARHQHPRRAGRAPRPPPRQPRPHSRAGTDRLKPASARPRGPGTWQEARRKRPPTTPGTGPGPGLDEQEHLTMNITVFGASGGIGTHLVNLAAQRGHQVRAIYRTTPHNSPPGKAEILINADIFDPGFAVTAIRGADVVITAVGPNFATRHNPRTTMTSPPDLHQRLACTLITAMKDSAAPTRLIAVSTASMGPADNIMGPAPRLLFRFFRTVAVPNLGRVGKDLQAMEEELTASGLDWYALRPVKLTDGPLTRNVQASDRFTMKSISRADVAWHTLTLAEDPDPGQSRTPVISTGPGRQSRPAGTENLPARQAPTVS